MKGSWLFRGYIGIEGLYIIDYEDKDVQGLNRGYIGGM